MLKILPSKDCRTITISERLNMDRLQIAAALCDDNFEAAKVKSYITAAAHGGDPVQAD